MRIIAGEARGRTLQAPKGTDTRPTQDYVRESLFNILRLQVEQAQVLDLFAGSGALALEAISRGATHAVLVDMAPSAIACIQKNVETLRYQEQTTVLRADWHMALDRLATLEQRFTLVFLDPPYRMTDTGAVCERLAACGLLIPDALVVVEHRRGVEAPPGQAFTLKDARLYGDTQIDFWTYNGGETDNA